MSVLGRHMIYDYPQYYNLFSRKTADAGVRTVAHTNRRLLSSYRGADGIKTGYTRAAGYNLDASAERGRERIIATVFGGRSTASRNAKVAELLDLGFKRAPTRVALRKPRKPAYRGGGRAPGVQVATSKPSAAPSAKGKTLRVASAAVTRSLRPKARPTPEPQVDVAPLVAELQNEIDSAVKDVQVAAAQTAPAESTPTGPPPLRSLKPVLRPETVAVAAAKLDTPTPARRAEVVTRLSTSGGRHWGINVGRYPNRFAAEKVLLKTALAETSTLDGTLRKVVKGKRGFDANFMGMTRDSAELACRRLQARQMSCFMIGPS
jgi:D-alanyl-D-alanine carboxypeptidase